MKYPIPLFKKAREMRLSGASLREIHRETSIAISTLSVWFKDIKLSVQQRESLKNRIKDKVNRGRMNASISIRAMRMYREKKIFEEADGEFKNFIRNPFFVLGIVLYWAHGAKKGSSFQFANSNVDMHIMMLRWVKKYIQVDGSAIKIRSYRGYKRIDISDVNVLRRMIAWQKLLIQYYNDTVV